MGNHVYDLYCAYYLYDISKPSGLVVAMGLDAIGLRL